MTRNSFLFFLLVLLGVYVALTTALGYADSGMAIVLHFVRIAGSVAALIIYIQMAPTLFASIPPPRRDYLLAGINFMLLSAVCFSFWNEAGRIVGVDTSVFSSPVSGLFSLFLVIGCVFVILAPDTGIRPAALIAGVFLSIGLVFIAPYFRQDPPFIPPPPPPPVEITP